MFKRKIYLDNVFNAMDVVRKTDEQIAEESRRDYAAYAYLLLHVQWKHPSLYELINVCGPIFNLIMQIPPAVMS
jgi:hypothetical protein